MGKEDVIKYVMKTPHNTNPAILRQKLDEMSPDWNQNDPSGSGYIQNRTHYDSRRSGEVKITFDGNIEGKECMPINDLSCWVKVFDYVPTVEEFMGSKVVSAWGQPGAIEFYPYDELWEPDYFDGIYFFDGMIMFVPEDSTLYGAVYTKGTWFVLQKEENSGNLSYISELSYTGTIGELKKLDVKYLPEDLVIDYSVNTPFIVSGSVKAVCEKLAAHQKTNITIFRDVEGDEMTYQQHTVIGVSMQRSEDGYGRLYIHFMYHEYNNEWAEKRIFVYSIIDGEYENTIGGYNEIPT